MMKRLFAGRFIRSIGYLLSVHLVALLFFFGLRVALFIATDYDFPKEISEDYALQSVAFLRGLWFDNVIACYILLLPLAVFWIAGWFGYTARWLYRSSAFFFIFFYSLCFIISAANIPYFAYFFKPINSSIFNWFDYAGTTAGMVFGETSYYLPIALGLTAIAAFAYITLRLSRTFFLLSRNAAPPANRWKAAAFTFVTGTALIGLCFFGIRGRRGYNPIKVSQAYYCNDAFLNQLGINPVFNLMTSAIDDNRKENRLLHLMAEDEAIARVQTLLGRKGMDGISPIARRVEADSLWQQSLSFSHFYSSGIHTNHGMYSSLYSFPAMMKRNAMKGSVIPVYSGLPTVLKENGYHNMFFMTHESQYDNMNAFFRTNGFDDIYSQENYPADKVVNGFGVQDDFLFQYALPVLDRQAQSEQPFFSVLLTISNHPPYIIPPYFHPRSRTTEEQSVEYADWSIRNFMTDALKRPWADHTLFVLLGDHGKLVGTPECESPQSYNHIPLMIYGRDIAPRIVDAYGGQVDLAPTLLGLLGIGYVQNDFGVDLLKEKRPYMYFTADNLIGVRDSSRLFLYFPDTQQEIRYRTEGMTVQAAEDDPVFRDMKQYGFAMLQCAETLVQRQQTLNHPQEGKR